MDYGLDSWGSIPGRGKRFFSSPQHPASYPMGTRGSLLRKKCGCGMKLTTHLHLMLRSRMVELYLHSPYVFMTWCLIN
jgi:hypothetical protein